MNLVIGIVGAILILVILQDAFEAIVLPRRVARRVRLTRLFYLATWVPWSLLTRGIKKRKRRDAFLGLFGPLSLLVLLGVWATGLVFGFAMIHWAAGSSVISPDSGSGFGIDLYLSGTTFFTLGLGDVVPVGSLARAITVIEASMGFGLLAMVISYLPVLYQSFSRREVHISMLDARAGTPPTVGELLKRHREGENMEGLDQLLRDWEHWSADLLESHLSYPVLCFFRSQHDNQSWLASLSTVLDTCSLVMVGIEGLPRWQAQLTFKMARHAVVDLAQVFNTSPLHDGGDRLSPAERERLRTMLSQYGVVLRNEPRDNDTLDELRAMYEPYVKVLSDYLLMPLPPWLPKAQAVDNWQTSAWETNPAEVDKPVRQCMRKIPTSEYLPEARASAAKASD
jgi:Ion channel